MNPMNLVKKIASTPTAMLIRKNSPKILLATGIVSGIATTIFACKGTIKAQEVIEAHKSDLKQVDYLMSDESIEIYNKQDMVKDKAVIYTSTVKNLVKVYSPAIGCGALSIASILGAYGILDKRIAGLTSAYTFLSGKFKEYRKRVVDQEGKEQDLAYYHGLKKEIVSVKEEVDGKKKTVKKELLVPTDGISQYARYFDDASGKWQNDPELNLLFLRAQQNYANDLLKSRGHLFLNEVYDMLDMPRTKAGQIVGWIYDETDPHADNFVDFGIYSLDFQEHRDFVNGYNTNIFLDFNVDGVIYDLI